MKCAGLFHTAEAPQFATHRCKVWHSLDPADTCQFRAGESATLPSRSGLHHSSRLSIRRGGAQLAAASATRVRRPGSRPPAGP